MKTFLKVWVGIGLIAIGFGIAVIILAFATGASWKDIPTYSMNESYDGVNDIDFDIGYGEVDIVEGSTFSIDARNMVEDGFESYVTDGTWYIREKYDNMVDVFGWRFSLRQVFQWHNDYNPKITITIPSGFKADLFKLQIGAGEVTADEINAVTGVFSVDAGRLKIDTLNVDDSSTYNVGTGEMELRDITAKDTKIECGVGHVVIDGTIIGDNDISCGVGSIELNLNGSEEDYNYEVEAGIGNIVIDGHSYYDRNINNDSDNRMKLDCGIGNITVDFH